MEKVLVITGMSCGHCKSRVEQALGAVAGVHEAVVDLAAGTAAVRGDASDDALRAAVDEAGFDVVSIR